MPTETDILFFDLFTTALEGGINYWSECGTYRPWKADGTEDYDGFHAVIYDAEDDSIEIGPLHINRDVIARGYNHAITSHKDKVRWSSGQRPPYVVTEESRENWDFDADDADAIVQLGLFGEVRYG